MLLDNVLYELGYSNENAECIEDKNAIYNTTFSLFLYKKNQQNLDTYDSVRIKKIISQLQSNSILFINNEPIVIFYEIDEQPSHNTIKKLWNYQIPFIIFNYNNCIKIYTSKNFPINTDKPLKLLEEIQHIDLNLNCKYSLWNILDQNIEIQNKYNLDKYLLENIKSLIEILNKTSAKPISTKLLLRLIFIRYMIDREIDFCNIFSTGTIDENRLILLNIIKDKTQLYALFNELKLKFNGNLFETSANESSMIDDKCTNTLYDFFSGKKIINTNQGTLFELYDFNIIPVELISSIYEIVLNSDIRKTDKAYYTPHYLADYIVHNTVSKHLKTNKTFTMLDPACGSGIFLVNCARKIIENNLPICNDNQLLNLIVDNIYGIDKNEDAIDVAIFSLYITILDYKNPKQINKFKLPSLKNNNLFVADFFDNGIYNKLKNINFDFIIGNPPWGKLNEGNHIKYCKQNGLKLHQNEVSQSFIYRTKNFSSVNTICSLLVTSKLLYNKQQPAKDFRKYLLLSCKIHSVTELATVRKILFKQAIGPACIISYTFSDSDNTTENINHTINHITIKPNNVLKDYNIIITEKYDHKQITQITLLKNDWAWKTIAYGSMYDIMLIESLKNNTQTLEQFIIQHKLLKSCGITINGNCNKDASIYKNKNYLKAQYINRFCIDMNGIEKFNEQYIHRDINKNRKIFDSIYKVLIPKGASNNFGFKAAYTEQSFVFPDAIRCIAGTDKNAIQSITALINSSLYTYFNLMLASSIGIEREQIFFQELLEYPFKADMSLAEYTQQLQTDKTYYLLETQYIDKLNKKVFKLFNIYNDSIIDYAISIQIPIITNKYKYKIINEDVLIKYINIFIEYFNQLGYNLHITASNYVHMKYCDVSFTVHPKHSENTFTYQNIETSTPNLTKYMTIKINNQFYKSQDLIIFGENYFRIIKNNDHKNWHPLIAQLDLSDIVNSILLGE